MSSEDVILCILFQLLILVFMFLCISYFTCFNISVLCQLVYVRFVYLPFLYCVCIIMIYQFLQNIYSIPRVYQSWNFYTLLFGLICYLNFEYFDLLFIVLLQLNYNNVYSSSKPVNINTFFVLCFCCYLLELFT